MTGPPRSAKSAARRPAPGAGLLAALLALLGGPVIYYAVRQPGYAHPFATFFIAWLVDLWDASYDRPRSARTYRWFCSMGCQAAFTLKARKGLKMIDFTEEETQALPAVMRALAPEMERIGWDRSLGQLTRNDMHRLIVTIISAFRTEMAEIASQSEIPF